MPYSWAIDPLEEIMAPGFPVEPGLPPAWTEPSAPPAPPPPGEPDEDVGWEFLKRYLGTAPKAILGQMEKDWGGLPDWATWPFAQQPIEAPLTTWGIPGRLSVPERVSAPWPEDRALPSGVDPLEEIMRVSPGLDAGIQQLGGQYQGKPPIREPDDWDEYERQTGRSQFEYLKAYSYESKVFDQAGKEISREEATMRVQAGEDRLPVIVAFALGGDEIQPIGTTLAEAFDITPQAVTIREVERGLQEKSTAYESAKAEINTSDMDLRQKVDALEDLYASTYPGEMTPTIRQQLKAEAWASLSEEDRTAMAQQADVEEPDWDMLRREWAAWQRETGLQYDFWSWYQGDRGGDILKQRAEKKGAEFNVEGLRTSLEPLGISILSDYPYISPITEAHLMRIPQPVLEEMAKYLESQGLSWRDFLSISSSLYGGGGAVRGGRFAIPRQWS